MPAASENASPFDALKSRDAQAVCQTYGRYPLAIARARGARLWDMDGNEYVDLLAGIAVTNLGHSHPRVIEAMARQAHKLIHVSNLYYQEEQVRLAELLKTTCEPGAVGAVFFCNSGAEANEAAIKLARRYMSKVRGEPRYEVITLEGSFHGRTLATLTATGQAKVKDGFDPLPEGFVTVPWNDPEALAAAVTGKTAAVLLEVVQGEGGVRPITQEYADFVAKLCKDAGILLMIDEIQTGLCRTGSFWAHQQFGLKPDVFTSAKALANGLPMGAMLCAAEAAAAFCPGVHATTFGGNAFCSAAAEATVKVMLDDELADEAKAKGARAKELFTEIAAALPGRISDIRGLGLMLGVELALAPADCLEVWKRLLAAGFSLNLTQERVLRLLPPLVIDVEDLEAFAAALQTVLSEFPAAS